MPRRWGLGGQSLESTHFTAGDISTELTAGAQPIYLKQMFSSTSLILQWAIAAMSGVNGVPCLVEGALCALFSAHPFKHDSELASNIFSSPFLDGRINWKALSRHAFLIWLPLSDLG